MSKKIQVGKAIGSAIVAGTLILGGIAGGLVGANLVEPEQIVNNVTVEKIVEKEVIVEVPVNVTEIVEKNVTVEVEVEDESFKQLACDRLIYDDMNECVEEVKSEDVALQIALNYIEEDFSDIADELEEAGLVADEDDVELVTVYNSYEDINVTTSDFDDNEYEFVIEIKVNDDDDKKKFDVTLKVEDGIVDIEKVE